LAQLQSLSTALTSLRRKQKHYESFLALTEETLGDPKEDVQPNVVTKQGPIADELRKMRTLLARVSEHLTNGDIRLKPDIETGRTEDKENWGALQRILDQVNRDGVLD
jgi:Kinetochore complex Fta4 of Sim4 subunit, or CENP-50